MIERDQQGKLTTDSKAALAIAGMPPSETAGKMEAFERLYQNWLGITVSDEGHILSRSWYTPFRQALMRYCDPLQIFRAEILELTEANTKLVQESRALGMRDQFYAQYLVLVERERELNKFLFANFPKDLAKGQDSNMPLVGVVKMILSRGPS